MHIPVTTPLGSIAPLSGVEISLHEFTGLSWHVLMPYALFGAVLMSYSQYRLLRGQRVLNRQAGEISTHSRIKKD